MLAKQFNQNSITVSFLKISWILLLLLWLLVGSAHAQANSKKAELPLFQDYKGVKIGMTADEVRQKLGKAQSEDKDGFLYVFDNDETAQIMLDAAQKVRIVSIMYGGDNTKPPACEDIFGKGIAAEKQANGSLYKLIQYPNPGYWISYNRMSGEKPVTMVTIQKLN